MRKYIYIVALLLLSISAVAQNRFAAEWGSRNKIPKKVKVNDAGLYTDQYDGVHHLIGLQAEGAYATSFQSSQLMSAAPGGYAAGMTLQYAYLNGPLFFQLGFGARWRDVQNRITDQYYTRETTDAAGVTNKMTYAFEQRVDEARTVYAQIPFYVGGYIHGAYILGGVKALIPLWGDTRLKMLVSSKAQYEGYIGPIEQMDNHGIRREVPLTPDQTQGKALKTQIDVLAVLEAGYELAFSNKGRPGYHRSHMRDQRLRIGAFAELGILNHAPNGNEPLYEVPDATKYDFQTFRYNHVFATGKVPTAHDFYAGLRVTYFFFGHQTKEKCLLCGHGGSVSPLYY